jgi:3-methylfumaryl-CoA hydratase
MRMSEFEGWIGRSQSVTDMLDPVRSNALSISLGSAGGRMAGDALPLLHHWLYFWDVKPPAGLGADGHPAKGGFLPPVALPRRMWAGGRLRFHKPLLLGTEITKTSTITAIKEKTGKSGTLVFVTVRHDLEGPEGLAVSEEQDLVYREAAAPGSILRPAPGDAPEAAWCEVVETDPVLLFRYSALTMNGHRIHYDRPYATSEEAYPALVVHGPLQATLLIDLAGRKFNAPISGFEFRGQQPAFDGAPLHICGEPEGNGARLWTQQGAVQSMVATVTTGGSSG